MNRPTPAAHPLLDSSKNLPFQASKTKKKLRRLEYFNKETIWGSRMGIVVSALLLIVFFALQQWTALPKGNFYSITAVAAIGFILGWRIGTQRLAHHYEVSNR